MTVATLLLIILVPLVIAVPILTWQLAKQRYGNELRVMSDDPPEIAGTSASDNVRELEKLRTAFYTNITHEFRTPLTVISGMASLIEENPGETEEAVEMIKRNSAGLLTLINQLLDLSKLDAGAMELKMIQGNVSEFVTYIVESLSSFADQQSVRLEVRHQHPGYVMDFDGEKLMQVVSNLVSNGIKFTPEGGSVDVWTHSTKAGGTEQFHITVRDTGIGIGTEHLPYIFSRFYRVEDTALKTTKGTGIGLALNKDLTELMNGEISVNSATGKGATFIVTLPVTRVAPLEVYDVSADDVRSASAAYLSSRGSEKTGQPAVPEDPEKPLVLVIEDSDDVASFIGKCIRPDYRVSFAHDGEAGIQQGLDLVPDLVITDVMMPKRDGFDVCSTLKQDERTSHIPIIMLTAKADIASKIEGLETGADAYMSKPFSKEELLVRLRKLLELRKTLQKRYTSGELIDKSTSGQQGVEDAFIMKLNEAIQKHIDDSDFNGTLLAREVAMSRSQLHNKIKALTGRSTALYVRYIRLLGARDKIRNSDLNISEVAYDFGFKDPAYFTRCFKEEFGLAPSELRAATP